MTRNLNNDRHGDSKLLRASEHLDNAWLWLCEHRHHAPADADVWHLRYHWEQQRGSLLATLLAGEYRLSPMLIVGLRGEEKAMWGAQDALVLKWVALHIADDLPLHARCEHVKGHGGGAASVRKMAEALRTQGYRWVLRTDVKGYYANIDKATLLSQVNQWIHHPVLRGLVAQYVHYTVEDGGTFHTPKKGIGRSCPLSPLMGALHLHEMDEHFGAAADEGRLYYARYMDDIVVLTHSRWHLRRHVRKLNQFLAEKALCQHPDKTFIGRTSKGFDWMGAWLEPQGVADIAPRAKANHREKVRRLYERARRWREPKGITQRRVSTYRWRWTIWAGALLAASGMAHAERIVITGGRGGIVGETAPKYAFLRAVLQNDTSTTADYLYSTCIGIGATWCAGGYGVGPSTQRAGYAVVDESNQLTGAVLIPVGVITSSRALSPGLWSCGAGGTPPRISATMTLTPEGGDVVISTNAVLTGQTGTPVSSSYPLPHGTDPNGGGTPPIYAYKDLIRYVQYGASTQNFYGYSGEDPRQGCKSDGVVSSTFNLRFALDAPPGGLPSGKYHLPTPVYAADINRNSAYTRTQVLLDQLDIVAAAASCSLSTSRSAINLSPGGPTGNVTLTASCTYPGSNLGEPGVDVRLTAANAGETTLTPAFDALIPHGAPDLKIYGAWSQTPPSCGQGTVKFDGSDGPSLGRIAPGDLNFQRSQTVSFRLCGTATPDAYTAQAVFQVVGR